MRAVLVAMLVLPVMLGAAEPLHIPTHTAHALQASPEKPIQPGAPVCPVGGALEDGSCSQWSTLNFVFRDGDGVLYIGASAHNFAAVGDRAVIRGEPSSFGTVIFDDDSVDFLHPVDLPNLDGTDFALIRIDPNRRRDVQPRVRSFAGPTGVTTAEETAFGDVINAYGQGRPDLTNPTGARTGQLLADSDRAFSSTVPEAGGDSGMPYLHAATGKALGVNANCFCGVGPGPYPTAELLLNRLASAGLRLSLVKAR